jgi:PIN domain nuclease of toxin-antitoxin system
MGPLTHLLDTHAVIWAYEDSALLSASARRLIHDAEPGCLGISDLTLLEIAMLTAKGRVTLDFPTKDFLSRIEADFVVLPVGAGEADLAMNLPMKHADPFDRVIVATALRAKVPLVTKDRAVVASKLVPVIW